MVGKGITTPKITVSLLSPHPLVLAEWERLLAPAGFELQARRLESTLVPVLERLPLPGAQIFVIDSRTPRQATEVLVAEIQESFPSARQIVVAENFNEVSAFALLRLGAKGLVSYAEAHEKLSEALRVVAGGGFWVPRDLLSRFIDSTLALISGRHVPPSPANLTQRERETLNLVLDNLANKEIADKLHIAERTVKFHVSSLLEKFGVRRRIDLILLCLQDRSPGP